MICKSSVVSMAYYFWTAPRTEQIKKCTGTATNVGHPFFGHRFLSFDRRGKPTSCYIMHKTYFIYSWFLECVRKIKLNKDLLTVDLIWYPYSKYLQKYLCNHWYSLKMEMTLPKDYLDAFNYSCSVFE